MTDKTRKIAVLTGDLVNSTGLGPEKVERAFVALEDCAEMQAEWMGGQSLHFTRHRGDGWQVALAEPKYALRSALCFRAALRALGEEFDSYIGISEGDVEGEIGPDLNEETSVVFATSGMLLENAKKSELRFWYTSIKEKEEDTLKGGEMSALIVFADILSRDWTEIQAQTLSQFLPLKKPTQEEVGIKLKKSRQAIGKTLSATRFTEVLFALRMLEASDRHA
ncbi:hypothetical protein [Celeribacter sp.]|uniref:hypothetical protein n=1 Tax=Celeribacter sp. TaxID=1890673 RepID=UPI003A93BA2F